MQLTVSLRRIQWILLLFWSFHVLVGIFVEVWKYVLDGDRNDLVYFFGLSYEQNFPTWWVSCLLLMCAICLAAIAQATREARGRFVGHWWFLALAFLYISLDETATLHEELSNIFRFKSGGVLYFGWVIPAGVVVALLGLAYLRFLGHLDRRPRWQFMSAGAIYVGGALIVELWLGWWTSEHGRKNLGYGLIDVLEEGMELLGVTLFLLALLEFLGGGARRFQVVLGGKQHAEGPVEDTG